MKSATTLRLGLSGLAWMLSLAMVSLANGQGLMQPAAGPVNRSMAGAGTAAPLDAIGALYTNPATISGLPSNELGFGMELLLADIELRSSVPGLGEDETGAEPGVIPIPSIGWVHQSESDPAWTYGLGVYAVAGFKTNYPASQTNPILLPQGTAATGGVGGFGRVFSKAEFLTIAPTISYALSDQLSIGFAPTVTMGTLVADPAAVFPPNDADGDGVPRYSSGRGTRVHWGGGAQIGVYYITDSSWHVGVSVKTPTWMEKFRAHSEDELGRPRVVSANFDLPMVLSLGLACTGMEDLVMALDVRYYDYDNVAGFRKNATFGPDGAIGLGWNSVMSVHAGTQYRVNDSLYARMGYSFNQNPIPDAATQFNIASPLIQQHLMNFGGSFVMSDNVSINMAYVYVVEAAQTGPVSVPAGVIPGSSITTKVSAHMASAGVTVRY